MTDILHLNTLKNKEQNEISLSIILSFVNVV